MLSLGGASSIAAETYTRAGWRDGAGRREQICAPRVRGPLRIGAPGVGRKAVITDDMNLVWRN